MPTTWKNKLFFGDNLEILRQHVADESVDLVYLDPPFNSAINYNVLFKEHSGEQSAAQIEAFEDTWHWGEDAERIFHETVTTGPSKLADLLQALRSFLGQNDMMAYLAMMAPRLVELRRVLKETGSIYLHCDPTASHYLKIVMDSIFGATNFRSEIVWKRVTSHGDAHRWSPVADVIFYYSKGSTLTWNPPYVRHSSDYLDSKYRYDDGDGRLYQLDNMTSTNPRPNMMYEWKGHASPSKGWRYSRETMANLDAKGRIWYPTDKTKRPRLKRYLDESPGMLLGTLWTDIAPINSQAQERLGYPTQKPEALLERIVNASNNEGDILLDPFCGCGTSIAVAERLKRHWTGIDITHLAITLIRRRLEDTFGVDLEPYEVIGIPKDAASAQELAERDRYQFQWWAVDLAGGRPAQDKKKGADSGIDGYIYFFDDNSGKARKLLIQVKSGHVSVSHIRDLKGVLEREKAEIGAYVCLESPTKPMLNEALSAGYYQSPYFAGSDFHRIQILTVEQLLAGQKLKYPQMGPATFKRAGKQTKAQQGGLFSPPSDDAD